MTIEREKGSVSESTSCPSCGGSLSVVALPDGGVSTSNCSTCYPPAAEPVAVAPQEPVKSEKAAALTRETGTAAPEIVEE